jgi:hypothetical protein
MTAPFRLIDANPFDEDAGCPNLLVDHAFEVFCVLMDPLDMHDEVLGLTRCGR